MRDGDQVSRALRKGLAAARHRAACGFLADVSPTAVETSPGDELFPLDLCRERFETKGLLDRALAEQGSYAEP